MFFIHTHVDCVVAVDVETKDSDLFKIKTICSSI